MTVQGVINGHTHEIGERTAVLHVALRVDAARGVLVGEEERGPAAGHHADAGSKEVGLAPARGLAAVQDRRSHAPAHPMRSPAEGRIIMGPADDTRGEEGEQF